MFLGFPRDFDGLPLPHQMPIISSAILVVNITSKAESRHGLFLHQCRHSSWARGTASARVFRLTSRVLPGCLQFDTSIALDA
jgi:hypothetical protein